MPPRKPSRFWRKCRIAFRRFRITVLSIIFGLLLCVLYLNQIGLPGFAKHQLQEKLRARGIDLEFTRMRWHLAHGIVAENVRFGSADGPANAKFSAKEAQLQFDYRALAQLRLQVSGLILRAGELNWQLDATNAPSYKLSLENIHAQLRLLPGDLWALDDFQAQFAGARFQLGGVITNASVIREWKVFHSNQPRTPGNLENRLRQLAQTLEHIHFPAPPELKLDVRGDATDLQGFTVHLDIDAPGADTPWGNFQQALLTIAILPGSSNVVSHAQLDLTAASGHTPWASASNLVLKLNLLSTLPNTNRIDADLDLSASSIETKWSQATDAKLTAQWQQRMTQAIPVSGHGELELQNPQTEWARARKLNLSSTFELATNETVQPDESWAWWTNLAPYALNWNCAVEQVQSSKLQLDEFACAGEWQAPELILTNLSSQLYGGKFNGNLGLNVANRQLRFDASSKFELKPLLALLPEKSHRFVDQFGWSYPPELTLSGIVPLPAWTNLAGADWSGAVRKASSFEGYFDVLSSSFRGLQFSSVMSHFSYSNSLWRLPDLAIHRPDGQLRIAHVSNEATRGYSFRFHSNLDPQALKPLLQTNQLRIYDIVQLSQPPLLEGEIHGRWSEPDSIGARAHLAVTNFSINGQAMGDLVTDLEYSNRFLTIIEPSAHRGTIEHGTATGLGLDFNAHKIYLTNAVGVADPLAVARAVGPHIGAHLEPYHFAQPVAAHVEGIIPMHDPHDADLHFDIDGGPLAWWKFNVAHVKGRLDWVGESLTLRNMETAFYGGTAVGNAQFDFSHHETGTLFHLDLTASDADLHRLMADLSEKTNRLQGLLTTRLVITEANASNLRTLQGEGRASLRDGLIWEIPIFGVLTPALETVAPGIGSAKANEGSATFIIKNGVARSDDLEIRASILRMQYWGTLDLVTKTINARVQAEPLRDMWAVGRLISFALWPVSKIFEYKITGPMSAPKSEPVFLIPKVVLMPFHPFRTMRELLPDPRTSSTNAPPVFAE